MSFIYSTLFSCSIDLVLVCLLISKEVKPLYQLGLDSTEYNNVQNNGYLNNNVLLSLLLSLYPFLCVSLSLLPSTSSSSFKGILQSSGWYANSMMLLGTSLLLSLPELCYGLCSSWPRIVLHLSHSTSFPASIQRMGERRVCLFLLRKLSRDINFHLTVWNSVTWHIRV